MSDEDKYAIIGKLHVEQMEAVRHGNFIREELEAVVKAFDALIDSSGNGQPTRPAVK